MSALEEEYAEEHLVPVQKDNTVTLEDNQTPVITDKVSNYKIELYYCNCIINQFNMNKQVMPVPTCSTLGQSNANLISSNYFMRLKVGLELLL